MAAKAVAPEDWRGSAPPDVVVVESSNRHVHLSVEALAHLFGPTHTLEAAAGLGGIPPELGLGFASYDKVDVVNPDTGKVLKGLRVLGPCRTLTQIELAYSDCRALGLHHVPTRISGDTVHSAGCRLVNPKTGATLDIKDGVIRAWRHVHVTPAQAAAMGLSDRDLLALKVTSPGNTLTFYDVMVRIFPFTPEICALLGQHGAKLKVMVHLDTDEANAAMLHDASAIELCRQAPDGSLVSLICNDCPATIETNASRKDARARWIEGETRPRDGVRPPTGAPRLRAELISKL
mmetsp:Transcript_3293/g.8108  ORF Transcript_3293/g.8108 Transcript_3293/m.8108 type:complete len:291 (+) Transcript_3293:160-1032(+)